MTPRIRRYILEKMRSNFGRKGGRRPISPLVDISDKVTAGTCKRQELGGVGSVSRRAQMCMAFIEAEGKERW
jgi:hypothetical protein